MVAKRLKRTIKTTRVEHVIEGTPLPLWATFGDPTRRLVTDRMGIEKLRVSRLDAQGPDGKQLPMQFVMQMPPDTTPEAFAKLRPQGGVYFVQAITAEGKVAGGVTASLEGSMQPRGGAGIVSETESGLAIIRDMEPMAAALFTFMQQAIAAQREDSRFLVATMGEMVRAYAPRGSTITMEHLERTADRERQFFQQIMGVRGDSSKELVELRVELEKEKAKLASKEKGIDKLASGLSERLDMVLSFIAAKIDPTVAKDLQDAAQAMKAMAGGSSQPTTTVIQQVSAPPQRAEIPAPVSTTPAPVAVSVADGGSVKG